MPDYEQIEFSVRNRLSEQEWLAQKATEILGEEETIRVSHAPLTTRRYKDIFTLIFIMARSACFYPIASLQALGYFFGLRKVQDLTELYDPEIAQLQQAFDVFNGAKFPDQGSIVLPP